MGDNFSLQWVLTIIRDVMPIQTLRHLTPGEMNSPSMKICQREFDTAIKTKLGDCMNPSPPPASGESMYPESNHSSEDHSSDVVYEAYEGLYDEPKHTLIDTDDIPNYDKYSGAEVMLSKNGEHRQATRVIGQRRM